jgi:hypothetical protein
VSVFRRRIAQRYMRDAVRSLTHDPITVAFRALSEPSGDHDLTFDWRAVLDERSRWLEAGDIPVLLDALANAREALQGRSEGPQLRLDIDLPLPLGLLVGYEWHITTRIRLELRQRTGSSFLWIEAGGPEEKVQRRWWNGLTAMVRRSSPYRVRTRLRSPPAATLKMFPLRNSSSSTSPA